MPKAPASGQTVHRIRGFRLVTKDLRRLTRFYGDALGFAVIGDDEPIEPAEMRLLGLNGSGRRQALGIGRERIALDQYEVTGRPYPAGGDAASLWFQHLALVVTDIAEAYARLRDATPISTGGPQQLPASSGGVTAFKFRDPEGHPLELLQFPPGNASNIRHEPVSSPGQIALGIDHSRSAFMTWRQARPSMRLSG